jgi:hypothetical protein
MTLPATIEVGPVNVKIPDEAGRHAVEWAHSLVSYPFDIEFPQDDLARLLQALVNQTREDLIIQIERMLIAEMKA